MNLTQSKKLRITYKKAKAVEDLTAKGMAGHTIAWRLGLSVSAVGRIRKLGAAAWNEKLAPPINLGGLYDDPAPPHRCCGCGGLIVTVRCRKCYPTK